MNLPYQSTALEMSDSRFRPLNPTANPLNIPPIHQMHPIPSALAFAYAQKDPTHPSAPLGEPDMQEFPASPRETRHRSPQNLTSEPQLYAYGSTTISRILY